MRRLHRGEDPVIIREEYSRLERDATRLEMAEMEQELTEEGIPRDEVRKFCDIHLSAFGDAFEEDRPLAAAGHPVRMLMEEHKVTLGESLLQRGERPLSLSRAARGH